MNVATCLNNADPKWVDLPALIDGAGKVLKRGQMQKLVLSVAQYLAAKGVQNGDLIGLAKLGHDQCILTTLATAAIGAVSMPLSKTARQESEQIKRCRYVVGQLADPANEVHTNVLAFPSVEVLENPPPAPALKLFENHGQFRISHSSGSTGIPKAVAITHEEQAARLRQRAQVMPIQPGQSLLLLMGLDAEVTMTYVLYVLARGGALVIPQGNGAEALWATVQATKPDYVLSSPHIWAGVTAAAVAANSLSSTQRAVVFLAGGKPDAKTVEDCKQHINAVLISDYGSTETGMLSINQTSKMDQAWSFAGKLLPDVQCEALDPDTLRTLPKGSIGLLAFKAPGMVTHYWDSPEDDRRFFHGGWFSTGDTGCVDDKGFLFVGARANRIVNRKGVKFDLDLLEQKVSELTMIKENAWVKHGEAGQEILTLVVVLNGDSHSAAQCKEILHQVLGDRYAPERLAFAKKLPRTPSGKIDREKLLQMLLHSTQRTSAATLQ